jgi:hypothetical protein
VSTARILWLIWCGVWAVTWFVTGLVFLPLWLLSAASVRTQLPLTKAATWHREH